jgi:hypothetical protein
MKFSYEDLISGDSIPVDGVGHLKSPLLQRLKPTKGIGTWAYNLYVNALVWDKADFLKFARTTSGRSFKKLDNEKLTTFDTMTLIDFMRELLRKAMAFFMEENLFWDTDKRCFISKTDDEQIMGYINRDNFEEVRDMMLQLNYIGIGKDAKPLRHSTKEAEALWERAQQYLKAESAKTTQDKTMSIGNIISKLCAVSTSYNLLNIYDLTIFQLYDQFFQYGYLRAASLNEMAFCNHGGKNFDMQAWLKPLTKF